MNRSPLNLRIAELEDAPTILQIFQDNQTDALLGKGIDLISVIDWVETQSQRTPFWVLEKQNVVCGWCSLEPYYGLAAFDDTVEVSLYIDSEYQSIGLGSFILGQILKHANRFGVHSMVAHIYQSNKISQAFFAKHGFQVWGCLPKVVNSTSGREDLMIMGYHLKDGF